MTAALLATLVLVAPVPGAVSREFTAGASPFAAGQHRGADFAAPMGTPVRASCAGVVAFAGVAGSSGRVVTLRCGRWRVTHLPLATIAVGEGERVGVGERLGTAGRSAAHAGLHLGVRIEGERFGYRDPLRFLAGPAPPPLGAAPRRPARPPRAAPPRRVARPPRAPPPPRALAPWPAWAGLALVLAGAGVGWGRRARRHRGAVAPHRPALGSRAISSSDPA